MVLKQNNNNSAPNDTSCQNQAGRGRQMQQDDQTLSQEIILRVPIVSRLLPSFASNQEQAPGHHAHTTSSLTSLVLVPRQRDRREEAELWNHGVVANDGSIEPGGHVTMEQEHQSVKKPQGENHEGRYHFILSILESAERILSCQDDEDRPFFHDDGSFL